MPHSVTSDLDLHCLFMSHKKDVRLNGVNNFSLYSFVSFSKIL